MFKRFVHGPLLWCSQQSVGGRLSGLALYGWPSHARSKTCITQSVVMYTTKHDYCTFLKTKSTDIETCKHKDTGLFVKFRPTSLLSEIDFESSAIVRVLVRGSGCLVVSTMPGATHLQRGCDTAGAA